MHTLNVEGHRAVGPYTPTSSDRLRSGTVTVQVLDGRLTITPTGGSNTKITYVDVQRAAAPTPVKVDFGTASSQPPAGWSLDTGAPLAARDGRTWGWVAPGTRTPRDLTALARQRGARSSPDARFTSFVHLQYGSDQAAWGDWQVELPDGSYQVAVGVGDPSATDSVHEVTADGVTVVGPFTPSSATRTATGSAVVDVTDGVLTLHATGQNTKLAWVQIDEAPAQGPAVASQWKVDFGARTSVPASGYLLDDGAPYADHGADSYGWVVQGTHTPLDLTLNGRQRASTDTDVRVKSLVHMQYPAAAPASSGTSTPGSWELAVPNGSYLVQVGAGDAAANYDSVHAITAEDVPVVAAFKPTATDRLTSGSSTVQVSDGRLTLAPDGTNTKITYAVVTRVDPTRPRIANVSPADGVNGVPRDTPVAAELVLPNAALDPATVTGANVALTDVASGVSVPASVNTSGGGDVIVISPTDPMRANTLYEFTVTDRVKDLTGAAMQPYTSRFTTGYNVAGTGVPGVAFSRSASGASGHPFTSLQIGPDRRMYAATLDGTIYRYTIGADGTLSGEQAITTVRTLNGGADRTVVGLAFDPAATAGNLILWVSDNAPWTGTNDVPDFTGSIDRLTGPDLAAGAKMITGLPRSAHDHMTNSVAFGPDGALYVSQGSNSGMGDPDVAWANRSEHLLNAAILRVDTSRLSATTALNVATAPAGSYDPTSAGAPLTLYATGVRNGYDLVWHSNGHLYVPVNGSSSGSNVPATPATLPAACSTYRPDLATAGPYSYTGARSAAIPNNPLSQTDTIDLIVPGGYYGHPNPSRCEYVERGGNPTSGVDPLEDPGYEVGVQPDRNLRLADIYDVGQHASPDGAIEYRGSAFGGALTGKILTVRYSAGKDVMALNPTGPGGTIASVATGLSGLTGMSDPVDLTEDVATGALYLAELGSGSISIARPSGP